MKGWIRHRTAPRRQRRNLLVLVVLVLVGAALVHGLVGGSPPPYNGPPTWMLVGRMAVARQGHVAVVLPGGEVLVAGGQDAHNQLLASAELFDPRTRRWRRTGSLRVAQAPRAALLLTTGQVLISGGYTGPSSPDAGPELYDPRRGTWAAAPALPPVPAHALPHQGDYGWTAGLELTSLSDVGRGRVLALGGVRDPGVTQRYAYRYDARGHRWSAAAPPPLDGVAVRLHSGAVLDLGTTTDVGPPVWGAARYDPRAGAWTTVAAPPFGGDPVVLSSGAVLILSTETACGLLSLGGYLADCDLAPRAAVFDPHTGRWATTGGPGRWRASAVVAALGGGTVLVAGGDSKISFGGAYTTPVVDAALYNPLTGAWRPTGSMATPRSDASAVLLPSGAVLVSGGMGPGNRILASAELYTGR